MRIDDPLDAAEGQIAAEERTDSALAKYAPDLADIAEALPVELLPSGLPKAIFTLKSLVAALGWRVRKREEDRRRYMADTLRDELRRVRSRLEQLDEEYQRFVQGEFWDLVLDGLQKAERTRSFSRITRIARILANTTVDRPLKTGDETEEIMRVAMDLDDDDIRVLAELVRGQKDSLDEASGRVNHEAANNYWRSGIAGQLTDGKNPAARLGMSEGEIQSHCAKLQAYGLIVQVQRNDMKLAQGIVPYSVLRRAVDFVNAIRSATEQLEGPEP
jgi:hypothetical protein